MLNPTIHEDKTPVAKPHQDQNPVNESPIRGSEQADLVPDVFPAEQVTFEKGLIGFSDHRDYGLMELPDERLSRFRLLQSVDDADLSFLLLPLVIEGGAIAAKDMEKALKSLSIDQENAVVLAIVTMRKVKDQFLATANIRAPVIIDLKTRQGVQYVFANPAYEIRHPINEAPSCVKNPRLEASGG